MVKDYRKPALSFHEQLEQLKQRGLVINDHQFALSQLGSISYYRLSAYWHPLRKRNQFGRITESFITGASFDDVIRLYEFDRQLRLLIIDAIERIEVYVRTLITYHLGHAYGAFGHVDAANFHPGFRHAEWLTNIETEVRRSRDAFITHYKNNYSGFPELPIWMMTEVMSLGSLSFCYKGLKNKDKEAVSIKLQLHHKRLADWLHKLTYIRNVCAHHSRLWNRELAIRPEKSRDPDWSPPVTPRNDRIFYILLMLRYVLKTTNNGDAWCRQCTALLEPIVQEDKWRVAMGMPVNWEGHPVWK